LSKSYKNVQALQPLNLKSLRSMSSK
jgi:hypothetical protein